MTGRQILGLIGLALGFCATGCSLAPKSFVQANDPAPLVRARALAHGTSHPDAVAIPSLIGKLSDPDAVVRLSAIEELKRRTGQDFGYAPWEDEAGRARSVVAWQNWWNSQQSGAMPSAQLASRRPVIVSPGETRRKRRGWRFW